MKCFNGKDKKDTSTFIGFGIRPLILLASMAVSTIASATLLNASALYPWTGFYVGGNVGYSWGLAKVTTKFHDAWLTDGSGDAAFLSPYANKNLKPKGVMGGVQGGYNYQINHWVPGIVVGLDYLGQKAKYSSGVITNPGFGIYNNVTSSYTINWLITVRPKLGYAIGAFLPYITGGLAIAPQKFTQTIVQQNYDFQEKGRINNTVYGWTLGAGAEYALANHWHLMVEYLFVDLPSSSTTSEGVFNGEPSAYNATHSVQLNTNIIHAGFVYRF